MSILSNTAFRVACALILLCTFVGIATVLGGGSLGTMIRDPASTFDFPVYAGVLSHLGIAILVVTAAIAGFGASFSGPHRKLLLAAAALTAFVAFDDLFMIHEYVVPEFIGIPERFFYLFYAVALAALLGALVKSRIDLSALKVAIFFLGLSVFADFLKIRGPFSLGLEDFSKMAGFGAWAVFWVQLAREDILRATGR